MKKALWLVVAVAAGLQAQTIAVTAPAASFAPGAVVPLQVQLAGLSNQAAGLQFEMSFAAGAIAGATWSVGPAAAQVGKDIACAAVADHGFRCLVYGMNATSIGDGHIATVAVTLAGTLAQASVQVSLIDLLGATPAANAIAVSAGTPVTLSVKPFACDLNGDWKMDTVDVVIAANQALGLQSCGLADVDGDGKCNLLDVLRVVNAALGRGCVTGVAGVVGR